MSERLPILRLPLVALEKVIKDVDAIDVFHLSLCSSRCHEAVRMAKPKKNISKISWTLAPIVNEIFLAAELQIDILERPVPKKKKKKHPKVRRGIIPMSFGNRAFSGQHAILHASSEPLRIEFNVKDSEARESLLKLLIAHLRSLFTCDRYHLNYKADPLDPDLLSHFLPIKTLIFEYAEERHNNMFYFTGLERGTIENFRIRKEYYFHGHQDNLKAFRELLPFKNMDLFYAPWLSFHNISTLAFVNLRVGHPNLSNSDVNQILRLWSSGDYPHIESICFPTLETTWIEHTCWKMTEILNGLDVVEEEDVVLWIIQSANGLKARITCCDTFFGFAVLHPGMSEEKAQYLNFWQRSGNEQQFVKYLNAE